MKSLWRVSQNVTTWVFAVLLMLVMAQPAIAERPDLALETRALADEDLKASLRRILVETHKTALSYSTAQKLIVGSLSAERGANGDVITDVYCGYEFSYSPGGVEAPRDNQGRRLGSLNVEHTWPQSKFGSSVNRGIPKSDLHHLFPSDKELNARRGNFKFGDVNGQSVELKCEESRLSTAESGPRFEPPDVHKGNVARALFYFAVRYSMTIDSDEERTLKNWNRVDPVDQRERTRNEAIERLQGVRNPFIDDPSLAERIADF